jgi:hypothetical protein
MRTAESLPDLALRLVSSRPVRTVLAALLILCLALVVMVGIGTAGKSAPPASRSVAPAVNAPAPGQAPAPAAARPLAAAPAPANAVKPYDWLQFNGDAQHSGNNTLETTVSSGNVAGLTQLFQSTLPSIADGAPVYLSGVSTSSGTRDLLFVTTKAGDVVALDAHDGHQAWIQQNPAGDCRINNGRQACYTTSSPVIGPSHQYVYSYGLDGKVHKYQVGDGTEATTGGWPEVATIKGFNEKGSSALAMATAKNGTTYLYVANSGYLGDRGDYQGHVTVINMLDGSQNIFNANCSDQTAHLGLSTDTSTCTEFQTAIWARPGVVYDPDTDRIYMATGNGSFNPSQHDWGDTVFALNPDGTGANGGPLDSYTPDNYQKLDDQDLDLGSTAPAILPVPAGSAVQHLAVQGGKDAMLRLLNLDDLSGQSGLGHMGGEVAQPLYPPQGGQVLTQPAVWVNPGDSSTWLFVADDHRLSALKLNIDGNGNPSLQVVWQKGIGASSPIVANNVLYYASSGGIQAVNPIDGTQLWSGGIGSIHWESPIVTNGILYITDESRQLTAFALP